MNPKLDVSVESQPDAETVGKYGARTGWEEAGSEVEGKKNTFCFQGWNVNGPSDLWRADARQVRFCLARF